MPNANTPLMGPRQSSGGFSIDLGRLLLALLGCAAIVVIVLLLGS